MNKLNSVAINMMLAKERAKQKALSFLTKKSDGIDGILVVIGLAVIALVLIVLLKDRFANYVTNMFNSMETKTQNILG